MEQSKYGIITYLNFHKTVNKVVEDTKGEEYVGIFRDVFGETSMMTSEQVADIVFQAIRDEKFYIFTHKQPIIRDAVKERLVVY